MTFQEETHKLFDEKVRIADANGYTLTPGQIKDFYDSRFAEYERRIVEGLEFLGIDQIKLYNGKLPFVVFKGNADENEKIAIYRQALSDAIQFIQQLN